MSLASAIRQARRYSIGGRPTVRAKRSKNAERDRPASRASSATVEARSAVAVHPPDRHRQPRVGQPAQDRPARPRSRSPAAPRSAAPRPAAPAPARAPAARRPPPRPPAAPAPPAAPCRARAPAPAAARRGAPRRARRTRTSRQAAARPAARRGGRGAPPPPARRRQPRIDAPGAPPARSPRARTGWCAGGGRTGCARIAERLRGRRCSSRRYGKRLAALGKRRALGAARGTRRIDPGGTGKRFEKTFARGGSRVAAPRKARWQAARGPVPGRGAGRPAGHASPASGRSAAPRPRAPRDTRYQCAYIFGAVCPGRVTPARPRSPLRRHRGDDRPSRRDRPCTMAPGAQAVLVLDGARWRGGKDLVVPVEHLPRPAAALRARSEPSRDRLAVPPRQLARDQRLRRLRRASSTPTPARGCRASSPTPTALTRVRPRRLRRATAVTTATDVAEAVWRVAIEPSAALRTLAGPDAVALVRAA